MLILSGRSIVSACNVFCALSRNAHLPRKQDPTSRLVGWKELGQERRWSTGHVLWAGQVFVFSDKYQVSQSELAFLYGRSSETYCVNLDGG